MHQPDVKAKEHGVTPYDFEGLACIGQGSFGVVYLVRYIPNKKLYALKVLDKDKVQESNIMKYALSERNVLKNIKHPFIVGLKYAFQTPKCLILVMKYCNNGTLA
jgi:protein-serine/threonine kinase|mmetsp:Transcript_21890/g.3636  ORF Transcript_21890/g.3636 Transcript_21890/m.3636 type:complete len:105 (-) Transcript_21890:621-935(-)